jgi:SHO1 osmosensor
LLYVYTLDFVTLNFRLEAHKIQVVGFLAAGLVMTTSTVNSLVYSPQGDKEAVAAGHILLSMVAIIWIFYFGSTPDAAPRAYLDSFALHREQVTQGHNSRPATNNFGNNMGRPDTSVSQSQPQMYPSTRLNGLETSSPVSAFPGGPIGGGQRNSSAQNFNNSHAPTPNAHTPTGATNAENGADVGAPTEYPYRAKAIYSYDANPEDANEISFQKHEILEVSDVSGRWWQARKENGNTGIAPSNYLILL